MAHWPVSYVASSYDVANRTVEHIRIHAQVIPTSITIQSVESAHCGLSSHLEHRAFARTAFLPRASLPRLPTASASQASSILSSRARRAQVEFADCMGAAHANSPNVPDLLEVRIANLIQQANCNMYVARGVNSTCCAKKCRG